MVFGFRGGWGVEGGAGGGPVVVFVGGSMGFRGVGLLGGGLGFC